MRTRRITGFLALTAIALTTAGAAIAAGTGTVTPPPRIAFVARSDLFPDALAAGPIAGRLGAPLFITPPSTLLPSVEQGLKNYAPEVVIIAGDTTAVSANVELAIEAALGLAPDKVVRAAGETRHETAVALTNLIAQYHPAFLPVDATAADSDLLDGMDSQAFLNLPYTAVIPSNAELIAMPSGAATFLNSMNGRGWIPTSGTHTEFLDDLTGSLMMDTVDATRLTALQICYEVNNAADKITSVTLEDATTVGAPTLASMTGLNLNSTDATCAALPLPAAVQTPWAIRVLINYSYTDVGVSHMLWLHGFRATWDAAS